MGLLNIFGLGSCANAQEKNNADKGQLDKLDSLLTTYESNPVYYAVFSYKGCLVDIRINDCFTDKIEEPENCGGTAITINPSILSSGKQNISICLKPYKGEQQIREDAHFELKIGYKDFKEKKDINEPYPWHWVYQCPDLINLANNAPTFYYEDTFEANVPYELTGWKNCISLDGVEDIEVRIKKEFERLRKLIISEDFTQLRRELYNKHYEIAIATYQSSTEFENGFDDFLQSIKKKTKKDFLPIENYQVAYYADKRLITLESLELDWFNSALLWLKDMGDYWDITTYEIRFGIDSQTNKLIIVR